MKNVLFIGHDAARSGAPIVLLHFLRWLRSNNSPLKADVLLLAGGELENEYRQVSTVFVLRTRSRQALISRGIRYAARNLRLETGWPVARHSVFRRHYDAVVGNTVISLESLKRFKLKGMRTICWLHELDHVIDLYSGAKFLELSTYVDEFVVPSLAVEQMLKRKGVGKKIHLVYDFSEFDRSGDQEESSARQELDIPRSAFVVGGSGSIEWRKGTDLFLQIALRSVAESPDLVFLWIGGKLEGSGLDYDRVLYDLERLDLSGKVIITGKQRDVTRYFAAIDLFALTSREDPFPLVCLEAASLGKPIICFDGAGGMPEFVADDAGAVVPYGDVNAFSDRILHFHRDRGALMKAGAAARSKVTTSFRLADSCRRLSEIVLGL